MKVGIISDTHGYLSKRAAGALESVDCIIHAGDIGQLHVLQDLQDIAPTFAVLGNNDRAIYGPDVQNELETTLGGVRVYVSHFPEYAEYAARSGKYDLCIHGHTHIPRDGVIAGCRVVNPGSASRPRGGSARSVVIMEIAVGEVGSSQLIELGDF